MRLYLVTTSRVKNLYLKTSLGNIAYFRNILQRVLILLILADLLETEEMQPQEIDYF